MAESVEWPEMFIGEAAGDHISIKAMGRRYPHASDFWDGNWLDTSIEVSIGGFRGDVSAALRSDELSGFRKQLERVNEDLKGSALLTSLEEWLTLQVTVGNFGKLTITGQVGDAPGGGNTLSFTIDGLDQSYLSGVIDALEEIEAHYPVLGSP